LANIAFNLARTHRMPAYRTVTKQLLRILGGWTAVMFIVMVGLFLFKASDLVSRVWLVGWFAAGAVGLVAFRLVLRRMVLHWSATGRLKRRTVIVGGGEAAVSLIEAIKKSETGDIELVGLFDD